MPPIPVDDKLYNKIKQQVYNDIPKHSAYRSGIVVSKYKSAFQKKYGPNRSPYHGNKNNSKGLGRWFKEEWVNQRGETGYINKFFEEKRQLSGIKHVYRKIGFGRLYDILKENKILGLVSDQDAKSKGIFVNFFNRQASTHTGAAKFHLNTGAPMIFGSCIQTDFQKYKIELISVTGAEKNVENITQEFTSILENIIRKYPEQNFWFHNRWKTIPQK